MDEGEAQARLESMVAASQDPVLSEDQLARLLAMARRVDTAGNAPTNVAGAPAWQDSHAYLAGEVVQESGRWWRCVIAGTSGTLEPQWPDLTGYPVTGAEVADNDAVWVDNGGAWRPTWFLSAAAAEGWRWKAAAASGRYQFTTDGQMFARQQIAAACLAMAKEYARQVPSSVRVLRAH